MNIVLIHGANTSPICWNWVGSNIGQHVRAEWDILNDTEYNLEIMEQRLLSNTLLVGHSMGGLYAWHLAQRNPNKVIGAISVATPWGGVIQADILNFFGHPMPWSRMVARHSQWTIKCRTQEPPVPWTNVICTRGFDFFGVGANDGVVSVKSQRQLALPHDDINFYYSHNEVLQSKELVDIILQRKLNS